MKSLVEFCNESLLNEARKKNVNNIVICRGGLRNNQDYDNLEIWVRDNCAKVAKLKDKLSDKDVEKCASYIYAELQERARKNAPKITVGKANDAIGSGGEWSLGDWKGPNGEMSGDIITFEEPK